MIMKVRFISYSEPLSMETEWNEESNMIKYFNVSIWKFEVDGIIHNWSVKIEGYSHTKKEYDKWKGNWLYRGFFVTDNNTNTVLCDTLWNEWDNVLDYHSKNRGSLGKSNPLWDLHEKEEIASNMRGRMNGEDGLCVNEKFRDSITVLDFVHRFQGVFSFRTVIEDFKPYFQLFPKKRKIKKKTWGDDLVQYGKEYTWTY